MTGNDQEKYTRKTPKTRGEPHHSRQEPEPSISAEENEIAGQVILEAEQLKASTQPPKGKSLNFNFEKFMQKLDNDDEFFHVTCHISPNIRSKIAKGEFIDLEQLLPKGKTSGAYALAGNGCAEENRVELVTKDGHTYFRPVKDNQITGLCRWEQAF